MSVDKMVRFLKGYVVICVCGHFCERFLNICMRRGIYLSDVKRLGEEKLRACISIGAFHEIREIARKTKSRVSIVERHGFPFVLHRYRKRKALFAGVILFAGILWYLTTHVMGIDVVGNNRIATADILSGLKDCGVYHGAAVKNIDDESVQNRMMTKFDDIAWVGVNLKGSRIHIEIKERLDTHVRVDADVPCDIVADKSGLVSLLEVKEGKSLVKVNQYVEKGDLLVSGVLDSEAKGMRFVHSFGEVYATTVYSKNGEYSFEYVEKIYTGQEKTRYAISMLGKRLNLFISHDAPFENFDVQENQKEYKAPVSFIPSLFVDSRKFVEYRKENKKRTLEETVDFGSKELSEMLDSEIPKEVEILDRKVTYEEKNGGVLVAVEYICREDIGRQRIIDKTELLEYDIIDEE